jgi:hypothetical protein
MIYFNCPRCTKKMRTDDSCSGKIVRCPKCGQTMRVPASAAAPAHQPASDLPEIIKFRCPSCNQKIGLDKSYAGKTVRCAKCKNPIVVPSAAPGQVKRPPDVDLLPSAGPAKTPQSDEAGEADFIGGDLLGEAMLSAEANTPAISPPGPSSDEEPLKLAADEPKEQPAIQKRCPRCNSMNPADAAVCSVCAFELAAPKAGARRASAGTNRPILAAGFCIVWTALLGFIVWTVFSVYKQAQAKPATGPRTEDAQAVGQRYIDHLKNSDISLAKNLLTPQLQTSVTNDQLSGMAKFVNKAKIADVNLNGTHYEPNSQGDRYYLSYSISYEDSSYRPLVLLLREVDNEFKVDGAASSEFGGGSFKIGPRNYNELSQIFYQQFAGLFATLASSCCSIVLVWLIIMVIAVICLWVVFVKAGQPGWAAIIPFYNAWVLAEVGDKPGWLGLLSGAVNIIPWVGGFISIALAIIIYIGVAKTFNRGVLFALGLVFLPFIFLPILAFTSD